MKIFFNLFLCIGLIFCNIPYYKQNDINKEKYYLETYFTESGGEATYVSETINFDSYTCTELYMDRTCPNYRNLTQINSCAPMAGSIVIGYYDYTCPNLIPNFEVGSYYNGTFYYRGQNNSVISMKEELYYYMGTNTIEPGTSITQFKTGLTNFVNDKGYSLNISECGSNFNLNSVKQSFEDNKPVVIFLNSYSYYDYKGISTTENSMTMIKKENVVGHVVVGYAYKQFTFYNGNIPFRIDNYLVVAFGDGSSGYLAINSTSCIDKTLSINIF